MLLWAATRTRIGVNHNVRPEGQGWRRMNQKDNAFIKRWQETRLRGRTRYLFVTGMLSWGVPMFVVMTFFVSPPKQMSPSALLLSAIVWFLGGLLFGYMMWIVGERRYSLLAHDDRRGDGDRVA